MQNVLVISICIKEKLSWFVCSKCQAVVYAIPNRKEKTLIKLCFFNIIVSPCNLYMVKALLVSKMYHNTVRESSNFPDARVKSPNLIKCLENFIWSIVL